MKNKITLSLLAALLASGLAASAAVPSAQPDLMPGQLEAANPGGMMTPALGAPIEAVEADADDAGGEDLAVPPAPAAPARADGSAAALLWAAALLGGGALLGAAVARPREA